MQIGLWVLLNSARFRAHFQNCFGAAENLLCCCYLFFVIVEIHWFGKATTLYQRRMAMLCDSHLSSSENKYCLCFSLSSRTFIMLNLQMHIGCILGSKVSTVRCSFKHQHQQLSHTFSPASSNQNQVHSLFKCYSCLYCLRAASVQCSPTKQEHHRAVTTLTPTPGSLRTGISSHNTILSQYLKIPG